MFENINLDFDICKHDFINADISLIDILDTPRFAGLWVTQICTLDSHSMLPLHIHHHQAEHEPPKIGSDCVILHCPTLTDRKVSNNYATLLTQQGIHGVQIYRFGTWQRKYIDSLGIP